MSQERYEHAMARAERDTRTLGQIVLGRARRRPRRTAVQDAGGEMSRLRLAAVAQVLPELFDLADDESAVGVMLPPGRGGTLVNLSLAFAGRTAVNLNHTAGAIQVARMCEMAGVRTIVSSRLYLQKIGSPELRARVVLAEDIIPRVSKRAVLAAMARTLLFPPRRGRSVPDDVALIIFSSGTTGDPKGIQLTHRQVIAHAEAVAAHLEIPPDTGCLASPLPLFHSFGIVPGVWMPLLHGMGIAGQPSPFDAEGLGELVEASRATILVSTPTFARGYLRRIPPERLRTLDFAVVGAERCPLDLHAAFQERFGCPLLEGYGCTELAPAISINTPRDNRPGTVGRPLPGVEVLTMEPETGALLPPGEIGLIVVRSPARMVGYLGRPDLTEAVFVHGGYNTGDIGRIDEDGFVHLTGRLARFAKLGGEMVPLDRVETALQHVVDELDQGSAAADGAGADTESGGGSETEGCEIAVAAVDDRLKGERLVVLYTGSLPLPPDELVERALADMPALWRPRPSAFHPVDAIPVLGTGKRDLGAIRRVAERVAPGPGAGARVAAGARDLADGALEAATKAFDRAGSAMSGSVGRLRRRKSPGDDETSGEGEADADGDEGEGATSPEPGTGPGPAPAPAPGDAG